jgi:hypothetical protein
MVAALVSTLYHEYPDSKVWNASGAPDVDSGFDGCRWEYFICALDTVACIASNNSSYAWQATHRNYCGQIQHNEHPKLGPLCCLICRRGFVLFVFSVIAQSHSKGAIARIRRPRKLVSQTRYSALYKVIEQSFLIDIYDSATWLSGAGSMSPKGNWGPNIFAGCKQERERLWKEMLRVIRCRAYTKRARTVPLKSSVF